MGVFSRMPQCSIALSLLIIGVHSLCSTTQADERSGNAVELKIYRTQVGEWNNDDNSAKVSAQVAHAANTYCAADPGDCGLTSCCTDAFKDLHIGVEEDYPKNDLKDMLLKIYVDLPSTANTTGTLQCVLHKSAVEAIVGKARKGIHEDTGSWVTYAGDEYFGIPIDKKMNTIIIPIACAVLVAVIILALILHFWNKKRESIARRKKIIEDRKKTKTAAITPTYRMDLEKPGDKLPEKPKDKAKGKDDLYKDSFTRQKDRKLKNAGSHHSEDSTIKLHTSSSADRHTQAFERDGGATGYGYDRRDGRETGHYSHVRPMESPGQMKPVDPAGQYGHLTPVQRSHEPVIDDPPPTSGRMEKKKKKKKKKSSSRSHGTDPDYDSTLGYENTGYSARDDSI